MVGWCWPEIPMRSDIICRVQRRVQNSVEEKAKTRWIEWGSASPNKQSFYPELSSLLTLPIAGYLCFYRLFTRLLTGFETRIRPWLKSKSCVHNAQYASRHYRTLNVIRSVPGLSPCWSTCCLTSQTTAPITMMVVNTLLSVVVVWLGSMIASCLHS